MSLTDNLVSHWRLNEASGTRVDVLGANDLSPVGAVGVRAGKLGDAIDLADLTTYLTAPYSAGMRIIPGQSATICFWLYLDSMPGTYASIFSRRDGSTALEDWMIRVVSSGEAEFVLRTTSAEIATTPASVITTGQWYFIAAQFDHTVGTYGQASIQVNNGSVYTTALVNEKATRTAGRTSVGIINPDAPTRPTDGAIDSMSFWNRKLSSLELSQVFNGGAALDYPFAVSSGSSRQPINSGLINRGVIR